MITIIDYGVGNLGSIANMFKRVGVQTRITGDINTIVVAEKLVLPGVGAFDVAIRCIEQVGLREVLTRKVMEQNTPLLGVCLGMQLLMEGSDEGALPGLGWIPGKAKAFARLGIAGLKVPHMGWNEVRPAQESPLLHGLESKPRFYFVHSYYVECARNEDVLLICQYGIDFHAAVQRDNIFGVQFHPEKSHRFGMRLFENFARL